MATHQAPAESAEQLARRIFAELHQSVIAHEAGSLAGEVEAIHDMRVAIRRLRVALSNFVACLPKEDRKRLRARLKRLADALGGVRDIDVMIAAMKTLLPTRPQKDKPAISALIGRLRARRRSRLRALNRYLSSEEFSGFKREFSSEPTTVEFPKVDQKVIEKEHGQAA